MDFTIPAGSLKTLIDTIATWLTFVLKLQQPHIHRTLHQEPVTCLEDRMCVHILIPKYGS